MQTDKVPQKSQKQQKGWRTAYATIIISAISAISAGHIKEHFRYFCGTSNQRYYFTTTFLPLTMYMPFVRPSVVVAFCFCSEPEAE